MLTLNGRNLLLGGFHDHWSRADGGNPSVFLAALNYYHYDFVTTMDSPQQDARMHEIARTFSRQIRMYPGREEALGWAHVVTVNPRGPAVPNSETDIRGVLTPEQQKKVDELTEAAKKARGGKVAAEPATTPAAAPATTVKK